MQNNAKEAVRSNMVNCFKTLGDHNKLVSFEQTQTVAKMESEISFGMFNRIFQYSGSGSRNGVGNGSESRNAGDREAAVAEEVRAIVDTYRARGKRCSWLTYSHEPDEVLEEALAASGLVKGGSMLGMSLMLHGWKYESPTLPDVEIHKIHSAEEFEDYKQVLAGGYEVAEPLASLFNQVFVDDPRRAASFCFYLACFDGKPACTVQIFTEGSVAGVYAVTTLHEYRSKGIAGATVARALLDAQAQGAELAILQASAMGRSVYAKLGFKEEMDIYIYSG